MTKFDLYYKVLLNTIYMQVSLSEDVMETGLFTFYMSDNKQNFFEKTCRQQHQAEPDHLISITNRRKQQTHKKSTIKTEQRKENTQELKIREEKLNKFLINCVGAQRRLKSIQNTVSQTSSKRYTQPIPLLVLKPPEASSKVLLSINDLKIQKKELYSQNRSSIPNIKNQNMESQMKAQNRLLFSKKSKPTEGQSQPKNQNKLEKQYESRIANYSIINLHIQNSRQSRSKSDQNSIKQKDKMIKSQQKTKKLTLNPKNEGYELKQKLDISEQDHQEDEEQLLALKINNLDKAGKLTQLYPRLIKHHSEQLCIKATQMNAINIVSLTPSAHLASFNYQSLQNNHHMEKSSRQLNPDQLIGEAPFIPPLKLPNIKGTKENRHKNSGSSENLKLLSKKIYTTQISSHIYDQQQKRKNRLQQIYKNNKIQFGLELGLLLDSKDIEGEMKINEIYYSIDNRQKKALQINFGAESKDRLFDGFNQRKKILIQKINEFTDRNVKEKNKLRSRQPLKRKKSKLKLQKNKIIL